MWSHDHDELDECIKALANVHAFLHDELAELDADEIRHHLHACERCMENFDIEHTITAMLKRSCTNQAPEYLRVRITKRIASTK